MSVMILLVQLLQLVKEIQLKSINYPILWVSNLIVHG